MKASPASAKERAEQSGSTDGRYEVFNARPLALGEHIDHHSKEQLMSRMQKEGLAQGMAEEA